MRGPQKASVPLGLKYHHVDVFSSKPLSGNGVTVFRLREALPSAVMQELTREMRQFESIFVLQEARSQTVRAWVFTMEEELDFAGHPVLGAAAALHEETMAGIREVSWTFQLNKKSFPVQTIRQDSHYRAEMDQGVCDFGATLSPQESIPFLEALNLGRDHLLDKFPLQIASTGLPYLLVRRTSQLINRMRSLERIAIPLASGCGMDLDFTGNIRDGVNGTGTHERPDCHDSPCQIITVLDVEDFSCHPGCAPLTEGVSHDDQGEEFPQRRSPEAFGGDERNQHVVGAHREAEGNGKDPESYGPVSDAQ